MTAARISFYRIIPVLYLLLGLSYGSFAQQPVTNQRLFDTISFIPEHGAERLAQFGREVPSTGNIIFLGNSITELGDWKKLTGDSTVLNRGIGGDITFSLLKRLEEVTVRKPAKIFLLIGINDIKKDIPPAVIVDNIRKVVAKVRMQSPGTKIYLQSILPVNPAINGFPQHYDKNSHILQTNALLKKAADELKLPFIDLHALFRDRNGLLPEKYTLDGLHLDPAGAGYPLWVKHLRENGYL
jgi:lysophospholipase L1-like esterase